MTESDNAAPSAGRLCVILDEVSNVDSIVAAILLLRGVVRIEAILAPSASIEQLRLSIRPLNALTAARILTIGDLTARSRFELQRLKNLGKIGLREIEAKLGAIGGQLHSQPA